jgi:hypothetical protein
MGFAIGNVTSLDARDQIELAVMAYTEISNGALQFVDLRSATELRPTPDKPNAARSETTVRLGDQAVKFFFIAFEPGNGTGDESARRLDQLITGAYPRITGVVPRDKAAAECELHLTVATFDHRGRARPFAGCLDLVGLNLEEAGLIRLGSLGQAPEDFSRILSAVEIGDPSATFTVWRSGEAAFGDQHAVYNATRVVQICGFLAIPRGTDPGVLRALRPQLPTEAR